MSTKPNIFRIFFIIILLGTSLAASIFMVIESADFFGRFYPGESKQIFGIFSAILNELFLIIMAAVWLPKIDLGGKKLWHPGNLFIKILMVILFINTVGGATFSVVQTKFTEIQSQLNRIEILNIRQQQLIDTKRKLDLFIDQNQKVNTVIASRELAEVQNELVKLKSESQSTATIWIDIVMLFLLRFTIQLSNITSVWIASWLFRQPLNSQFIIHGVTNQNKRYNKAQDNIYTKKIKNTDITKRHDEIIRNKKKYYQSRKNKVYPQNANLEDNDNNKIKHQNIEISVQNLDDEELIDNDIQHAKELKEQLDKYLMMMPPSVTPQILCNSIGIDYRIFKSITDNSNNLTKGDVKVMKKIIKRIESKYQQENF